MKFAPATAAALAAATVMGSALADGPTVQFNLSSPGGGTAWNSDGVYSGSGNTYQYIGSQNGSGWSVAYNMIGSDTWAQSLGVLGGSLTLTNTSSVTQTFSLSILLPTLAQGTSSMTGGSVSGVLTADADGGSFTSAGGLAGWTAFLVPAGGGSPFTLASLLNAPYSVTALPFEVANLPGESFGDPIPNLPSPAMGDGMGITLNFQLGAGDKVDFTTVLVMQAVPTPGALALVSAAGLLGSRRRKA